MLNLTGVLSFVVIVGACSAGGFLYGSHVSDNKWEAAMAKQQQAARIRFDAKALELNAISQQLEEARHARKADTKVVIRNVEKIVTRAVYRGACFDDDGLRNANAALLGKPLDPGKPDAAVPTPDRTR